MKRCLAFVISLLIVILLFPWACNKGNDCADCGDLTEGYLFTEVTADNIAEFVADTTIQELQIGACVRYQIIGSDKNNISVVDNCCCD
jgi:hypothetical protein